MRYYPISKKWGKIKPHINSEEVQNVLVADFNKYTYGRWRKKFEAGMTPHEFESCDWWCDHKGRIPQYWQYVKHAACHWLVNFNLELAKKVAPNKKWRIVSSQEHSTVWDGEETLFDFNFLALGVEPNEAFELAKKENNFLKEGERLEVYEAEYYKTELPQHWN
jgi:hypothetical protein